LDEHAVTEGGEFPDPRGCQRDAILVGLDFRGDADDHR
jgi:hypothetical protein